MATFRWFSTGRLRWRPLGVAAGATVALLLASGPLPSRAPAAPTQTVSPALPSGYEILTQDFFPTLSPNQPFAAEVRCASNKDPIGGGASLIAEPDPSARFSQIANGPNIRALKSWRVTYVNLGASAASVGFRVWAFCVDQSVPFTRKFGVDRNIALEPGGQDKMSIRCDSGYHAVGGGPDYFNFGSAPLTLIKNSAHGEGWEVTYLNTNSTRVTATYNTTLYCLPPTFAVNKITAQPSASFAPGQSIIFAPLLTCNGSPLGGGFNLWDVNPSTQRPTLSVLEDGPIQAVPPSASTQWRIRVLNYGSTPISAQYRNNLICIS